MENAEVENLILQLANTYKEKIPTDSSITSIYIYGSYVRGDFILGKSDLNFAIFLNIPNNEKIEPNSDLSFLKYISENIISLSPNSLFRTSSGLSKFIYTAYALNDIRKIIREEPFTVDSVENLTFLAFDFLKFNKLLYGRDVLKDFENIPDPLKFKEYRFKSLKENYFSRKAKNRNSKLNILLTLSGLISYLAVIDGIRDIRKEKLIEWSENYSLFAGNENYKEVIERYFMYSFLDNLNKSNPLNDEWMKKAEYFIEEIFKG